MEEENKKLLKFKEKIKSKKVAVIGMGISNIPAVKYLTNLGASIVVHDKNENLKEKFNDLEKLGVKFILGKDYLKNLNNYDYIIRSPGIKPFLPEIEDAVKHNVILTSEIELLLQLVPCKVIGVTGTEGKTTTTTIISKALETAGYKVWLGGNIGIPLFAKVNEIKKDDIVVVELSSFQLMTMKTSPNISIITNIYPDHLNYHRNLDEYIDAKANIFMHQKKGDILVLNADNDKTQRFIDNVEDNYIENVIRYFSVTHSVENGTYIKDGYVVTNINGKEEKVVKISDIKLIGIHNIANICAAVSAIIDICGIKAMNEVSSTFTGVEHRLEMFKVLNGVKWYNDSIGTSPASTMAGLNSFEEKIIHIAGGSDKNIPYDEVGRCILKKVKTLLLVGDTAEKIKSAVISEAQKQGLKENEYCDIHVFENLKDCVDYAYKISKPGDNVVMSPASASFDKYKNFEERGNYFKELVNKLG